MATKLKNIQLTSVDLVRAGANQQADICLYKSADPTEQPTEGEKNIIKRFIHWLKENPTEGDSEPTAVENTDDMLFTPEIYKDAITKSLQSIIEDETLSTDEKKEMIEKSIGQYHDKMVELTSPQPVEIVPETEVEKSDQFDIIEEVPSGRKK